MADEVITRAEARARGLRRYFTGQPCENGHVAERLVRGTECVACRFWQKQRERFRAAHRQGREIGPELLAAHDAEMARRAKTKPLRGPLSRAEIRERNRDAQRRHRLRPGVKERGAEYIRRKRIDEEFVERERLANLRGWRSHWPKSILPTIRHRAKAAGLEFSITPVDIPVPETCPVLGLLIEIPPIRPSGSGLWARSSPSVDRIDNTKGYVPGNVRVISMRANHLKRDATLEELRALVAYLERENAS